MSPTSYQTALPRVKLSAPMWPAPVERGGFEPPKAFASGFTVRPVWPLRYLSWALAYSSIFGACGQRAGWGIDRIQYSPGRAVKQGPTAPAPAGPKATAGLQEPGPAGWVRDSRSSCPARTSPRGPAGWPGWPGLG